MSRLRVCLSELVIVLTILGSVGCGGGGLLGSPNLPDTSSPAHTADTSAKLSITTTALSPGEAHASYHANLSATGGLRPYTWTISSGDLPAGLTLLPSGTIAGTPTTAGTDLFTVHVKDTSGHSVSKPLSLTIAAPDLAVTTVSLPSGQAGSAYSSRLLAGGGTTPYTWSLSSGSLPPGLSLAPSGTISGTASTVGSYPLTAQVADGGRQTARKSFSLLITSVTACGATGSGVCRYVSPLGSDSNPGTSASPFRTIQAAANVVNPGDMVIVRDGTYNNPSKSGVGSKLIVMSRGGTAANHVVFTSENKWGAKIDGLNNTTEAGWEFAANYIDVKNFSCAGFSGMCFDNYQGGQFIDIDGNNIHDIGRYCATTTNGRVGIFISSDNVIIERNQIHDIGRYAPGENGCVNPLYYENNDHGIYVDGAFTSANNVTIKNNIFYRNERGWSIQVYPASVSDLAILNNTFLFPNPYRPGHIIIAVPKVTNLRIENNISYAPQSVFITWDGAGSLGSTGTVVDNVIYNGRTSDNTTTGVTYLGNQENSDAELVSPGVNAYDGTVPDAHLQAGSPAIDMGLPLTLDVINDYDGTTRVPAYDIGAYVGK
jgi:Putative Ig domain/Protein of unknown function (DUF1565)